MFDGQRPIVMATGNPHKVRELARLAASNGLPLIGLSDVGGGVEVAETGVTFAENAALKAVAQAAATGHVALAEDSGLCVDALDGLPGLRSARFAVDAGRANETQPRVELDEANNVLLLERLANVTDPRRTAFYVCSMALADPDGTVLAVAEGRCHGRIMTERRGAEGFGYDPLFEIVEYRRTFGELGDVVKNIISHRTRAFEILLRKISDLRRKG